MVKKCLVCEQDLVQDPHCKEFSTTIGIVYEATIWRTHGNYGSTKFDPVGPNGRDEFLEAYICDPCLSKKGPLIYHVDVKVERTEVVEVRTYAEQEKLENRQPTQASLDAESTG